MTEARGCPPPSSGTGDPDADLRTLRLLVQRYPEQACLAVFGEPPRRTVDDVREDAADCYPRVDWAAEFKQVPQEDLLKVIAVLTRKRDEIRALGRDAAEKAGDPTLTAYARTEWIAEAAVHLNLADTLDEEIAHVLGRTDLLDGESVPAETRQRDIEEIAVQVEPRRRSSSSAWAPSWS